jgi:hypothetical protein
MRGRWTSRPKHGKGIGPVRAERMVKHFGVDLMHIIGVGRRGSADSRPFAATAPRHRLVWYRLVRGKAQPTEGAEHNEPTRERPPH